MVEGSSNNDMPRILNAIRFLEIVENQVQLFTELGNLDFKDISDMTLLVDCLITFWEDFACLDLTQCMLNRSILKVALRYIEFDLYSSNLPKILTFGIKANSWCSRHLKTTLLSTQESEEEEHVSVFYQLLQEALMFSASTFSVLMNFQVYGDKELMDTVANFILEALYLTKASLLDVKDPLRGFHYQNGG